MTIYDEWGKDKYKVLKDLGVAVEVMWQRTEAEKPVSGSLVRQRIMSGEEWESLVPASVADYIKSNNLASRIKANV